MALGEVEDDAPRQQAGNLLERDLDALAMHGDGVLLVAVRRGRIHGIEIFALLIADMGEDAADWRTVDMYVKDAEEDADSLPRPVGSGYIDGLGDQPIARRHNQAFAGWDRTRGIAEKPEEKCRQKHGRNAPRPIARSPRQHNRHSQQA